MSNRRLFIVGYGKMGREIEAAAEASNIAIEKIIHDRQELEATHFGPHDTAICFTRPAAEADNIRYLTMRGVSMVVGTTGWQERVPELRDLVAGSGVGFLSAGNFSLGVLLFSRIVAQASAQLARLPGYDVLVHEWHHNLKVDGPSGTAKILAEKVLANWPEKDRWVVPPTDRALTAKELGVSFSRGGQAFGEHRVLFDSGADTITLTHHSKGRAAYAHGALAAARWLADKKGLYTLDDLMADLLP